MAPRKTATSPVPPGLGDPELPTWLGQDHLDVLTVEVRDGLLNAVSFHGGLLDGSPRDSLVMGYDDNYDVEEEDVACGRTLRALLDRPVAERLAHVRVDAPLSAAGHDGCYGRHVDFLRDLLARDRPSLQTLELDRWCLPQPAKKQPAKNQLVEMSFLLGGFIHWAELETGDLSALWSRAPRLSTLVLAQPKDSVLGEVDAPALETLVFGASTRAALGSIAKGRLDALETLVVRVQDAADVRALLANPTLDRVRHLGLIGSGTTVTFPPACDELVDALLGSRMPEQLETLDLGGFVLGDAACARLQEARSRFASLRALRLSSWAPRSGAEYWWYGDDPRPFQGTSCSPHKRPAGKALAEALPVVWLTVSGFEDDPPARHHIGVFREGHRDQDNFAERRPASPG